MQSIWHYFKKKKSKLIHVATITIAATATVIVVIAVCSLYLILQQRVNFQLENNTQKKNTTAKIKC